MYNNPTEQIILNGEKRKAFPLISGTRQRWPFSQLLFNIVLKVLATTLRPGAGGKNLDCKRRKTLFADDMILYTENPKNATRKLLELINKYTKVTIDKVNTQKTLSVL